MADTRIARGADARTILAEIDAALALSEQTAVADAEAARRFGELFDRMREMRLPVPTLNPTPTLHHRQETTVRDDGALESAAPPGPWADFFDDPDPLGPPPPRRRRRLRGRDRLGLVVIVALLVALAWAVVR